MKNLFLPYYQFVIICLTASAIAVVMHGCVRKGDSAAGGALEPLIEKIETAYVAGCQKIEQGYVFDKETRASQEVQEATRARLLSYQKSFRRLSGGRNPGN